MQHSHFQISPDRRIIEPESANSSPAHYPAGFRPYPEGEQPPRSGFWNWIFGQCCSHDSGVDAELREVAPATEDEVTVFERPMLLRRGPAVVQAAAAKLEAHSALLPAAAAAAAAASSPPRSPPRRTPMPGQYLIDNSMLQAEGHSGVQYRLSKNMQDKIQGAKPALWGEVVLGLDEGDGWLKVGQHYLPMAVKGVPVLTPLNWPALWTAMGVSPCDREIRQMAAPVYPNEAHAAAVDDALFRFPEYEQEEEELEIGQREEHWHQLLEHELAPIRGLPPRPLLPEEQAAQQPLQHLATEEEEAQEQSDQPQPQQQQQPKQDEWFMRPSVGTWHQAAPRRGPLGASGAELLAASSAKEIVHPSASASPLPRLPWQHRPSVGSWMQPPRLAFPGPVATCEEKAAEEETVCVAPTSEPTFQTSLDDGDCKKHIQLLPPLKGKPSALDEDDGLSPSTMAPDSPYYTPLSCSTRDAIFAN